MAQGHGERAEREHGHEHQEAIEEQNAQQATNGAAQVAKPPAPTEAELRAARDVVARAKANGVKLTSTGSGGQARIMLPNGETRHAYIQRRWKDGVARAQILKEIQSCGAPHDKCTYQIVFSATKELEGGPPKAASTTPEGQPVSLVPAPAPAA